MKGRTMNPLHSLSRQQCEEVIRTPTKRGVVRQLAEQYAVSEDLIRFVRSQKWMVK